ncbi:MAG TPA: hypothetical protein VEO54_22685 [Thermoanaerobaculia bacterium]|nr:hypothetical protein [Thermoanaerobaculia bacterium]
MTQQLGIVVIVDVDAALQAGTLEGCTYFFENAGPFGSTGMGTDRLVSAINGTYWADGSQASEQVLNFVVTGVKSLPITLPKDYAHIRARQQELQTLAAARTLAADDAAANNESPVNFFARLRTPQYSTIRSPSGQRSETILLDYLGQPVSATFDTSELPSRRAEAGVAQIPPIITDITGEAVEKGIIYPAQYGSPDLVNGGWYWSATVATFSPRVWSYTLHIALYRLVQDLTTHQATWEPVQMSIDAKLNILNRPMRNGFTGGGTGLLPIGMP